jgi:hypothetical protein
MQSEQAMVRATSVEDSGLSTTTDFSTELAPTAAAAEKQFEIQSAIVLARRFPRNEEQAFEKLMRACKRTSFAESAEYSYPRGQTTVAGPSVNVAREAARVWGNIRYGIDVTRDDADSRSIRGWAWDLETNTKVQAEDDFKKVVFRKGYNGAPGKNIPTDERELRELTNRRGAILVRNCILQILPKDLIEDALFESNRTLQDRAAKDPEGEKKRIIMAFSELRITPEMLGAYLTHPLAQCSPAEIAKLRGIYKSISDGHTTWAEYVNGNSDVAAADLKEKTKAKADELKDKLTREKKTEVPDEKAETKRLKAAIKKKYQELDWDEAKQDKFQGGKDINAYKLDDLEKLNNDLTEELANT